MSAAAYQIVTLRGAVPRQPGFRGRRSSAPCRPRCSARSARSFTRMCWRSLIPDGAEIELRLPRAPARILARATRRMRRPGWRSTGSSPRRNGARPFASPTAAFATSGSKGDLIAVDWPIMPFADTEQAEQLQREPRAQAGEDLRPRISGRSRSSPPRRRCGSLTPDLDRLAALDANAVIVTAAARRCGLRDPRVRPKTRPARGPGLRNGASHHRAVLGGAARKDLARLASALSSAAASCSASCADDAVTIAGLAVPFLEGMLRLAA